MNYELNFNFNFYKEIAMENKKYNELELYMLLRLQAKLVQQTKYTVIDNIFKTGVSGGKNMSIFSMLGVLMDLQNLNVFIKYPNTETTGDKITISDLITFIAKNYSNMKHTTKTIDGANGRKTVLNWIVLNTQTFESRFADFIDYLQNDLKMSLILPTDTITTKQKLKSEDSLLALSKIEAKLKKQKEELDLIRGK